MLSEKCIERLEEKGFNRWRRGGYDRLYLPVEEAGLYLERYGTGNISFAKLNGSVISNNQARKYAAGELYIEVKSELLMTNEKCGLFHINEAKRLLQEAKDELEEEGEAWQEKEVHVVWMPYADYKQRFSSYETVKDSYDRRDKTIGVYYDGEYLPLDEDPSYKKVRIYHESGMSYGEGRYPVPGTYSYETRTVRVYEKREFPIEEDPAYKIVNLPYDIFKREYRDCYIEAVYDDDTIDIYVDKDLDAPELSEDYELVRMQCGDLRSGKWDAKPYPGIDLDQPDYPDYVEVKAYIRKESGYKLPEKRPVRVAYEDSEGMFKRCDYVKGSYDHSDRTIEVLLPENATYTLGERKKYRAVRMPYKDFKKGFEKYETTDGSYSERTKTIEVWLPEDVEYERAARDKHYEERAEFRGGYVDEITITPDVINPDDIKVEVPECLKNQQSQATA